MSGKEFVKKILRVLNDLVPKKYVSFCSNPDFGDNPQALYDYLVKNCDVKGKKFIWHLQNKSSIPTLNKWIEKEYDSYGCKTKVVAKYSLSSVWCYFRSRTIVTSHGMYDFKSEKQTELLLWHGMPLKKIGFMNESDKSNGISVGDFYSVTAPVFKDIFVESFHAKPEQIYIDGQCRNDYMFKPENGILGLNKYIIYMPTFRKSNLALSFDRSDCDVKENTLFNLTSDDWDKINQVLKQVGIVLVVKPHPFDSFDNIDYIKDCEQVRLIDDKQLLEQNVPLYKFVAGSEALVTDYSSIYVDYLLTNKPIAFYIPDYSEYMNNRGFVFDDYEKTIVGEVCQTSDELIEFLRNPTVDRENYERIKNEFNEIQDAISSQKIVADFAEHLL